MKIKCLAGLACVFLVSGCAAKLNQIPDQSLGIIGAIPELTKECVVRGVWDGEIYMKLDSSVQKLLRQSNYNQEIYREVLAQTRKEVGTATLEELSCTDENLKDVQEMQHAIDYRLFVLKRQQEEINRAAAAIAAQITGTPSYSTQTYVPTMPAPVFQGNAFQPATGFLKPATTGYTSSVGTSYQYDLSNPTDRMRYRLDPSAQLRDRVTPNPLKRVEGITGQYGAGIQ